MFSYEGFAPSQITPQIFIGPFDFASGKIRLEELGFTHSVSLQAEFDSVEHGLALAHHCHLPTIDLTPPTIAHLLEGAAFIDQAVKDGGKVYVHCAAGVGRSPTLVATYFIQRGMAVGEAIDHIMEARSIRLTSEQVAQLAVFETIQRGTKPESCGEV